MSLKTQWRLVAALLVAVGIISSVLPLPLSVVIGIFTGGCAGFAWWMAGLDDL